MTTIARRTVVLGSLVVPVVGCASQGAVAPMATTTSKVRFLNQGYWAANSDVPVWVVTAPIPAQP